MSNRVWRFAKCAKNTFLITCCRWNLTYDNLKTNRLHMALDQSCPYRFYEQLLIMQTIKTYPNICDWFDSILCTLAERSENKMLK